MKGWFLLTRSISTKPSRDILTREEIWWSGEITPNTYREMTIKKQMLQSFRLGTTQRTARMKRNAPRGKNRVGGNRIMPKKPNEIFEPRGTRGLPNPTSFTMSTGISINSICSITHSKFISWFDRKKTIRVKFPANRIISVMTKIYGDIIQYTNKGGRPNKRKITPFPYPTIPSKMSNLQIFMTLRQRPLIKFLMGPWGSQESVQKRVFFSRMHNVINTQRIDIVTTRETHPNQRTWKRF